MLIEQLLTEHQLAFHELAGISINNGPGSYTGLRVANMAAKALCYVHHLPLVPIPGHDILFHNSKQGTHHQHVGLIDANKSCAYVQVRTSDHNSPIVRLNLLRDLSTDPSEQTNEVRTAVKAIQSSNSRIVCSSDDLKAVLNKFGVDSSQVPLLAQHQHACLPHMNRITEFDQLSLQVPHYVLPPNITKRRKPLIG